MTCPVQTAVQEKLAMKDLRITAQGVVELTMTEFGIKICETTARKALNKLGFSFQKLTKKQVATTPPMHTHTHTHRYQPGSNVVHVRTLNPPHTRGGFGPTLVLGHRTFFRRAGLQCPTCESLRAPPGTWMPQYTPAPAPVESLFCQAKADLVQRTLF